MVLSAGQTAENQSFIRQRTHEVRLDVLAERARKRAEAQAAAEAQEGEVRLQLATTEPPQRPALARRIVAIHTELLAIAIEHHRDEAERLQVELQSTVIRGLPAHDDMVGKQKLGIRTMALMRTNGTIDKVVSEQVLDWFTRLLEDAGSQL